MPSLSNLSFRRLIGQHAPPVLLGMIDYYRFPKRRDEWDGPFNGQSRRCQIVDELFSKIHLNCIIETGSFRGVTTEYFSKTGSSVSVHSVEAVPRNYGFCRMKFLFNKHVNLYLDDSRSFLKKLIPTLDTANNTIIFVYLDAHWWHDLPLFEELAILLASELEMIIMIDDFEVPDDRGYKFDDYGPEKCLTRNNLNQLSIKSPLFYPKSKSSDETGKRRGCVVLAHGSESLNAISSCSNLRVINDFS